MSFMVVYESVYGNTEKIAVAIAQGLGEKGVIKVINAGEGHTIDLEGVTLLVVGSPTHGGRPTPGVTKFLDGIEEDSLSGIIVAAFDTRLSAKEQNSGLRFMMRMIGYAADKIAKKLKSNGGSLNVSPEGFIVEKSEGPLRTGEEDRARDWGKSLVPPGEERMHLQAAH